MNNPSSNPYGSTVLSSLPPAAIGLTPIGRLPATGPGNQVAFRIPAYQRGYRWIKDDVTRLLDDLREFLDEDDNERCRPFYCLQPLVVKKVTDHEWWEVVDGQQRLTTIYLILKYLNASSPFDLSYATRKRSLDFFDTLEKTESDKKVEKQENIDFHHIYHAHQAVKQWFASAADKEGEQARFRSLLTNSDNEGRNVRFIWYELGADDDAVAAFTRLNVGKIPLTDEELIRALFLRNPEGSQLAESAFQHRLALEWDRIETALQAPDFWGFVSNQRAPEGGRIYLLFELCAPAGLDVKNHSLFRYYERKLEERGAENVREEWQQIVSRFEQLEEWYRDPELFHLIGFLTTILGSSLRPLLEDAAKESKPRFAAALRTKIQSQLIDKVTVTDFISSLGYGHPKIRQTLALFNIAVFLRTQAVSVRFPFHLFHGNAWDIEHVHSQAGEDLSGKKAQKNWLNLCREEVVKEAPDHPLIELIGAFINQRTEAPGFVDLHQELTGFFGEAVAPESLHSIGNLTLLDSATNRAYKNAPFAVKRATLLAAERRGTFVLPCTRDLFLKVFSENPGNLRRWDIENDGAAHEKTICQTLETFFSGNEGAES